MFLFEQLKELKSISSRKEKESILEKYLKDNDIFYEILLYTYDYKKMYYVTDIKTVKTKSESRSIYDVWDSIKIILNDLSERMLTGLNALKTIENYLSIMPIEEQKALIKILNKHLNVGISVKTINKILKKIGKEEIPEFKIQLANKYDPNKIKKDKFYVSYKIDGIRGFYNDYVLYSRTGHEIKTVPHIEVSLKRIMYNFDLSFIDGEIYKHFMTFSEISSKVNSDVNTKDTYALEFWIFAVGHRDIKNTQDMIDILNKIKEFIHKNNIKYVRVLDQTLIESEYIDKELENALEKGFEGLMLRDVKIPYEFKRGNNLLKVKKMHDIDMVIESIEEGAKGSKYENMCGRLLCSGVVTDDEIYKGQTVKCFVGSGLSDKLRKEIWDKKDDFVGKKIKVKYFSFDRGNDGNLSLRFPVFLNFI